MMKETTIFTDSFDESLVLSSDAKAWTPRIYMEWGKSGDAPCVEISSHDDVNAIVEALYKEADRVFGVEK